MPLRYKSVANSFFFFLPHFITGGRLQDDVHKEDGEIGHGTTL